MTAFVLDCSIAMSWAFVDEQSHQTDRLLGRVRDHGAIVPALWFLEVANAFLQSEFRGRTTRSLTSQTIGRLRILPIEVDDGATNRAFHEVLEMARSERLTTYDATYLELAMRRSVPLATKDRDLAKACRRRGVPLLLR
jgi:predicted nucleic acid-binding protein